MFKVSESVVIAQPAPQVFDAAANPERQLRWDPGTLKSVEQLTPGPLSQGSRYRGKFAGFGLVEYEYAEYQPDRKFSHKARVQAGDMLHLFEFQPVAAGTR